MFGRAVLITICGVAFCLYSSGVARSQESTESMRVTIIAVNHFEDPSLSGDSTLTTAIHDNALTLKEYFERNFNINVRLFETHDETSDRTLRDWLRKELPADSEKGVNLIFFLTHGFARPGLNKKKHDSEIYLATSNTFQVSPEGNAISGTELIEAFKKMPERRAIFLFIDSCGSGAIDGDSVQESLRANGLGSRVMILASSMEDELSYRARFTEALRTIWMADNPQCKELNDTGCHCGGRQVIEPYLTTKMNDLPGVSADVKQKVRLVSRNFPDFCIDLFGSTQRLLFLFNGSPGDVDVNLKSAGRLLNPIELRGGETIAVNLNSSKYKLIAQLVGKNGDDSNYVNDIPLDSMPVDVEVLFGNEVDQAEAEQKAAFYLRSREMYPDSANQLMQASDHRRGLLAAMYKVKQGDLVVQFSKITTQETTVSAQLVAANSSLAAAREKLAKVPHCKNCYQEYPEWTAAAEVVDRAQARADSIKAQELALQEAEAKLEIEKRDVSTAMVRLAKLQERTLNLSDYQIARKKLIETLAERARNDFSGVMVDNRGINILFPDATKITNPDIEKLTALTNDFSNLQIEIEVPNKRKGQRQIDQTKIAESIRAQLLAGGMKTTYLAARSYWIRSGDKPQVRIILSLLGSIESANPSSNLAN